MHLLKDRGDCHTPSSDITPQPVYSSRRKLLQGLGAAVAGATLGQPGFAQTPSLPTARPGKLPALAAVRSALAGGLTAEKVTPYADASTYNNYYEFGTDKADPARLAGSLKTRPWAVTVEGEVKKPGIFDIDALLKLAPMEERIYRLRCVEGWSMVIP